MNRATAKAIRRASDGGDLSNAVEMFRDLAKLFEEGARAKGLDAEDCRSCANALWDWLRKRCRWCGKSIPESRNASRYCTEVCCMEDLGEEPEEIEHGN